MTKRIVLVEDDEPIRDSFMLAFAGRDYEFIEMANARKILHNEIDAPDLFILDKNISGTDGLDVCRFIKGSSRFADVPVIMLSANPNISGMAKDAGADYAINKPFSLKEIRDTLSHILD